MLPPVQNFAVRQATSAIGGVLGTHVSIEHVNLRLFNQATIEGLYVEDLGGDTLLYVKRLDVGLKGVGMFTGGVKLGKVKLTDGQFRLRQQADGRSNLTHLLAPLKKEKEKKDSKFKLTAPSVEIYGFDFSFRKYTPRTKEYGVNFDDVDVRDLQLTTERLSIIKDSVTLRINDIAFAEKSGFEVSALSTDRFTISGSGMLFDKLHILTPDSDINMNYLNFVYSTWKGMGDFLRNVRIESETVDSRVGFATIAYFSPKQREWGTLENVNFVMSGPVAAMTGVVSSARLQDTELALKFAIDGLPDINKTRFNFDIDTLRTNAEDVTHIANAVAKAKLSESMANNLQKLGNISMDGHFEGSLTNFNTEAVVATQHGGVRANLKFAPGADNATTFIGDVAAEELLLGAILGSDKLGIITLTAGVNGTFTKSDMNAITTAKLARLDFNGYSYKEIALGGTFHNRSFRGHINSGDPNLDFLFNGMVDFGDSIPHYDFDMNLNRADLHTLGFNKRDSVSVLHCDITAHGSGSTIDNLNGNIVIGDLLYINPADSVRINDVTITGKNNSRSKYIAVNSAFADAQFRSRMSYASLYDYFTKTFYSYIPSLSAETEQDDDDEDSLSQANPDNYSMLSVNIKEANNVANIFKPGLVIAEGTNINFMFNPDIEKFTFSANSDYIELGNNFISKLNVTGRNHADSVEMFMRAEEIYTSGFMIPDFSVIGGIKNNRVNAALRFADADNNRSAMLGVSALFARDAESGLSQIRVNTTPSYFKSGEQTWNIAARDIVADSSRVSIGNFLVRGSDQLLRIHGTASRSRSDTLHVNMSNFDLSAINGFIEKSGYAVDGYTSGHADLSAIRGKNGILQADIKFDSLKVNDVNVAPIIFTSNWDFERERASFMLANSDTRDTVVTLYFRPTDKRYLGHANLKNIDLSLLNPVLEGVVSKTDGSADADLDITTGASGPLLNGKIKVGNIATTVDFLNVRYNIADAVINVKDNVLDIPRADLTDPQGGKGDFSMHLNLQNFSNIAYDFNIKPNNMLVMNTTIRDNELFYGKVFASGGATIKGNKQGVNMDISASTEGSSAFYLPLSNKSDVGDADFIVFTRGRNAQMAADSTDYLFRKRMIMNNGSANRNRRAQGGLNINMALNVRPNAFFQLLIDPKEGHTISGRGNGSLNLHINPKNSEFNMYGDYEITEGVYNFSMGKGLIEKPFTIEQGSTIQWTGEPMDALLNISAVYKLKTSIEPLMQMAGYDNMSRATNYGARIPIECRILLSDRLAQPDIAFTVQAPGADTETQNILLNLLNTQETVATQFFYLLALGSFYAESGATQSIGTSTGASTGVGILNNVLNNAIASDKFNLGINYRPKDTYSSDEVSIDISQKFMNNRIQLDIEGNYDTGNNPTAVKTSNLTGDFYLTWLIDRAGNLKFKAFSRTIDRFDENQGLQEYGVGLYYVEDFNTVKDIVRNMKERFSGLRRKQRKAAEAQEQQEQEQEQKQAQKQAQDDNTAHNDNESNNN
jgi:hypothetical protein